MQIQNACLKYAVRGSVKIQNSKIAPKSPSAHHRTTLSSCIFATKACIDNRQKLLNGNISICPQNMLNFSPLTAEICWRVWGTPANFNGCRVLAPLLAAPTSLNGRQPNFARCLAVSCKLQNSLCVQVTKSSVSYIGSVNARHSSSGHQPKFTAWYKEWKYGTFTEGATYIRQGDHHVGHRPTLVWELTYRSEPLTDFLAWWLGGLAQGCAFMGFVDMVTNVGVKSPTPRKKQFWGRE